MDKNKISNSHLKQMRDRLFIAQRAYKTLSKCGQGIIRATNERDLLHKVCEAIVKEGGYRLAWIGFAEHNKNKTVRPVAQAGYDEGYLDTLNITWADKERGWSPTGTATRTDKPSVVKNILTNPNFAPWRSEAIRHGYESSISIPLIASGQSFGALNIYAAESDAFDEEEVKLLTELADELAYGITALRTQIERKQAEDQVLRQRGLLEAINKMLLKTLTCETREEVARAGLSLAEKLTESKFGFICEVNQAGRFDTIAVSDSGWDACKIPGTDALLMLNNLEIRGIRGKVIKDQQPMIFNDPSSHPDWIRLPKDHPQITCFLGVPLKRAGQTIGMIGLANKESGYALADKQDMEALSVAFVEALNRKQEEEKLKYSEKNYRELVENALVGVYKTNVKGEILFANEALAKMLEFESPEEMISTAVLARYKNPKDREVLIENLAKEGKVSNFELELLTKTGQTKNAILSATLDGDILSGMMRDITERKRAEKELYHTLEILRKSLEATTQAICMIVESRDPYTAGHQRRVADLARAIAAEMSLSGDIIDGIRIAALLHDIGKISIPSEILSKPSKLNKDELSLIKAHPKVAYDILSSIEFPWPIADIILQHHERMDGSGYPQGLSDDDILIEARILGVADVAAAMVSHRPYRPAHKLEDVINELSQKSGALFDSKVTEVCLRLFKEKNFSFRTESAR